eukprot:COSAG05_NODE_1121_length_5808_cov_2.774391_7_plen_103_part_00
MHTASRSPMPPTVTAQGLTVRTSVPLPQAFEFAAPKYCDLVAAAAQDDEDSDDGTGMGCDEGWFDAPHVLHESTRPKKPPRSLISPGKSPPRQKASSRCAPH